MEEEIKQLKEKIERLEDHFDKYLDHKYQSKNASRKPDREKGSKNMISSARYIENLLMEYPCWEIVKNGNQFQFEDFWRYVESDMPGYLKTLKDHLEKLHKKI